MRLARVAVVLAVIGTVAFMVASLLNLFVLDFVCYDMCPPEDGLADALAHRLTWYWQYWLPGLLALVVAWLLCMALLGRARRWGRLLVVLVAPLAGVGLAAVVALWAGGGHLLPTTWSVYAHWGSSKFLALVPLLLGPLAIIWACRGLDRGRSPTTPPA